MGRMKVLPGLISPCTLLFLLPLVLLPLSLSGQRSLSIEEEEFETGLAGTQPQKNGQWLKDNYKTIIKIISSPIPFVGSAVGHIMDLIPEADKISIIHYELSAMNARLDIFYEELKWASGDFQLAVDNIANPWLKYAEMVKNNKVLQNIFVPFYSQFVDSVSVLHKLLTPNPEVNTQSLGDVLAKKLRCHEKDVEAQFVDLITLVCKGNMMDEKYYELKGVSTDDRKKMSGKIASESSLALFKSHQRCVSNGPLYMKRDIIERIDANIVHQEIANNIGTFLQKTYDRYEWLVVAFTTHNTKNSGIRNHILKGFSEIKRGPVTVAVAFQVKGGNNKADEVKQAIARCVGKKPNCDDVNNIIKNCEEKVLNTRLSDVIIAQHIYGEKSQSFSQSQHIYTGKCNVDDNFEILFKSDEELAKENPCDKLFCANGGKCELAPLTQIAMCQCPYPFYGRICKGSLQNCERSSNDPKPSVKFLPALKPQRPQQQKPEAKFLPARRQSAPPRSRAQSFKGPSSFYGG